MWSLDTDKVDLGFVNPTVGKKRYKITDMKLAVDKKDPSGKTQYIQMAISNGGVGYSVPFFVMAKDETQVRIANQNLAKIANAVGIKGVLKPERLKSFVGKELEIDFQPSKRDPKYINMTNAYPVGENAEESQEEEAEEKESFEEEETEEVAPATSKKPWLKK